MKKVCGYKSKEGNFYEKKSECELADLNYELREVKRVLDNLHNSLEDHFLFNVGTDVNMEWMKYREYIFRTISKIILRDSDNLIQVVEKKKELSAKLEELQSKIKYKKWWLKYKWW